MHDTAYKKKFAKQQQRVFKKRGIMATVMIDSSEDEEEDESGETPVIDVYTVLSQLDRIKNERDDALHEGWQANRSISESDKRRPHSERRSSIFSDAEKVEKLINVEFTFERCFGKEPIETKYQQVLRQYRNRYGPKRTESATIDSPEMG